MHEDLPRASTVLATVRSLLGTNGTIKMSDHGHGLGAVHVTVSHWLSPAAGSLSTSTDWEYLGPGGQATDDDTASAPSLMFSRWVRLDGCNF